MHQWGSCWSSAELQQSPAGGGSPSLPLARTCFTGGLILWSSYTVTRFCKDRQIVRFFFFFEERSAEQIHFDFKSFLLDTDPWTLYDDQINVVLVDSLIAIIKHTESGFHVESMRRYSCPIKRKGLYQY